MKATGVTRSLDHLGRIVIPVEIRRNFDIREEDQLEFYVEEDKIILKKFRPSCTFCGNDTDLTVVGEKHICRKCIEIIKGM